MKQLIFFLLFSTAAFAQSNPFITHMYTADPSAHVWADGRLYVYASHDIAPPRGCDLMDEYHVFSTDDMINWTDHGEILRASQVPWGKPLRNNAKFMWAPDCAYKNGKYYFYFPHPNQDPWNSNWKIGVAVSDKPASGFKVLDHPMIGLPDNGEIDPCVFVDTDGKAYFYYGGGGKCFGAKLKDNMYEIDGELKPMEGLQDFHEATWVHKRNGIYYLSYSDNHDNRNDTEGVKGNNRMRYATSKNPLGPWEYKGIYMDPTDSYTNHGSIVEYKGQWYAFYHNSELSRKNGEFNDWLRSICVDKLYYNNDGTIKKVIQTGDNSTVQKNVTINPYPESGDVVSVKDFGAKGDGKTDDTQAFQKAMDSFGTKGGTVYAPRGTYLFKGSLSVPVAVTLKGAFESVPSHNGIRDAGLPKPGDDGTTFLVTGGQGNEQATPFITLNTNSTLRGVVLYWPTQDPEKIPETFPWAVAMRGKNPALLDVEMLNPYNAIDASKNERALIRNISGQPLRRGIYVDGVYDIGRIENVHWNPWWSQKPALLKWQEENGEAFIFERTDWHYVLNTFCFGYKTGYKFGASSNARGSCNGNFLGIGADACHNSVLVEQSAPYGLLITNGEFVAMNGEDPTMVVVTEANRGNVRFVNCAFWGPCNQNAKIDGQGTVGFSDCMFVQWDRNKEGRAAIQAIGGSVVIRGCDFGTVAPQVSIGQNVSRAIVSENTMRGKVIIDNKGKNTYIQGNLGTEE